MTGGKLGIVSERSLPEKSEMEAAVSAKLRKVKTIMTCDCSILEMSQDANPVSGTTPPCCDE